MNSDIFKNRPNKLVILLFVIILFYTVSLFLAPLTLKSGTVSELDGNANMVDYSDKWDELSPYHQMIYLFSDFNCHQKHYRSYSINGNQMPVCARDVGIFLGMSAGFFLFSFVKGRRDYKDVLLSVLGIDLGISKRKRYLILTVLAMIFILPMALDGGIQLATSYESTNPVRTITGLLFGLGFSAFIASVFVSASHEISQGLSQNKPPSQ